MKLETEEEKGIFMNGKKYLYSINKSENKEEVLVIKFYNPNNKSDIYLFYLWSS